ncbi:MAG: adenylate/guanylate cyclase domain-containing protein [Bacteroidia bacterium]|jgi:class 3 adenylate cyclase
MIGDPLKHKILYVDDEPDNLVVFKSAFRRFYEVLTVATPDEALEKCRDEHISIIITDQRMPGMTGVELLKTIPAEQDVIRMVLTGFSDVEAIIEAINSGKVYKYITKPWDKNDLKFTIDNAIEALELRLSNKTLVQELREANEQLEQKVLDRTREIQHQKEEIELQKKIIEDEKIKSDSLLLNILPDEIAEELKLTGEAKARRYNEVTVLFSDFKDFTSISENCSAEDLVHELNECFSAFDDIIEKFDLEKIKTIGDAYMCAGGLPVPDKFSTHRVVLAAVEMQQYLDKRKAEKPDSLLFQLRIGIHTGPVIAGVVGKKKFAYDIWGDTVNIAARMESSGEPGRINISSSTYELIKNHFECQARGKVVAKGKGELDMFFVVKEKSQ